MSRWSPGRSAILSLLLDEVTGTEEVIDIRRDFCKIRELLSYSGNISPNTKEHFTGSVAEGLELPNSDRDYMQELNYIFDIEVVKHPQETYPFNKYVHLLRTENVRPGFALLEIVNRHRSPLQLSLPIDAIEVINNVQYLSANLFAQAYFDFIKIRSATLSTSIIYRRQGPSVEQQYSKVYEGTDLVPSIHCSFWPDVANEWSQRVRHYEWPTHSTISSIISFGFHLVPVGHPHSETKLTEWRISFSLAERSLVWSFNHVQLQCYAVMKIILKQFIKKKCSPQNQVLCSYFIKTYLFWKFETIDLNFWRVDNFRECITYLIIQFVNCIRDGIIRHYFIPDFNLLSVKLTREAQSELLQLFDIVIQYDVRILKECRTLRSVWSKFLSADENQISVIHNAQRSNFLNNDYFMAHKVFKAAQLFLHVNHLLPFLSTKFFPSYMERFDIIRRLMQQVRYNYSFQNKLNQFLSIPCKTNLKIIILKQLLLEQFFRSLIETYPGNRTLYKLHRLSNNDSTSLDISRSKLWYAIVLLNKRDFMSAISIVNQALSSIPLFALKVLPYDPFNLQLVYNGSYIDKFMNSGSSTTERARRAWLMPFVFYKSMSDIMPLAIQIELYFSESDLGFSFVSPLVILHYLAFHCYHELGQYENRDNALQKLVDFVNSSHFSQYENGLYHHVYSITGHCLLVVGKIDQAREMFLRSNHLTQNVKGHTPLMMINISQDKGSAAEWYLHNFCG